jgi:hypothetical protein
MLGCGRLLIIAAFGIKAAADFPELKRLRQSTHPLGETRFCYLFRGRWPQFYAKAQ